jgi:DNA-binding winged helix-turn-helix (wHTH) protein/tetratricopeptide (TPR) repeat protein
MKNTSIKFDDFQLDIKNGLLLKNGAELNITKKAIQILSYLVINHQTITPAEFLLKEFWKDTYATEAVLMVNISTLRKTLGKKPNGEEYIINKPRQGYYFNAQTLPIAEIAETDDNSLKNQVNFYQFVGRDSEINLLENEYKRFISGEGKIILLQGEAGIGKTTLIKEFIKLRGKSKQKIVFSQFHHYKPDKHFPYELFFKIIWELLTNSSSGYSYNSLVERLENKLNIFLPKRVNDFDSIIPGEIKLFGIKDLNQTVGSIFNELSKIQPIFLVFDDIHFADFSGLEILEILRNLAKEANMFIVLSSRSVNDLTVETKYTNWLNALIINSKLQIIKLKPLEVNSCKKLIARIFGNEGIAPQIPQSDIERILNLSQGNPYFLVEIIRWLLKERVIYFSAEYIGKWQWRKLKTLPIPESLIEIGKGKTKQLSKENAEILSAISVFGTSFQIEIIGSIFSIDKKSLETAANEFMKLGIIIESDFADTDFQFSHSIQRQIVYESGNILHKKHLHQQIADYFSEKHSVTNDIEIIAKICQHYKLAGEKEKAWKWNLRAGELLTKLNNWSEALSYLEKIDINNSVYTLSEKKILRFYLLKIECFYSLERLDELLLTAETLSEKAQSLNENSILAITLYYKAKAMILLSKYEEVLFLLDEVLKYSSSDRPSNLEGEILHLKAILLFKNSKYREIIKLKSDIGLQNIPKNFIEATLSVTIALSYCFLGEPENAFDILKSTIIFADSTNHPRIKFYSVYTLANAYFQEGKYEKAIAALTEAKKELVSNFEAKHSISVADYMIASARIMQGNYREGIVSATSVLKTFEEMGIPYTVATINLSLGYAYREAGDFSKSKRALKNAIKTFKKIGDKDEEAMAWIEFARLNYLSEDFEAMLANSTQALNLGDEIDNPRCIGLSLAEMAVAQAELKQHHKAMQTAEKAIDVLGESTLAERWRVFFAHAKVILINQKHKSYKDLQLMKKAEESLIEAVDILDEIRSEIDLEKSENLVRYSQVSKSNSAPALLLVKLWQKSGETKKARLLAKEWFLKV